MQVHQGVDIIGYANEPILAMADGIVLETASADCVGPNVVIDHGFSSDNKRLITIYSHTGEYLVQEGEKVKRGSIIAKLPEKIEHPCMARVRHLHVQIGQQYCEKEDKGKWGCQFFIRDLYRSLNPNDFWLDEVGKIRCFEENKIFLSLSIICIWSKPLKSLCVFKKFCKILILFLNICIFLFKSYDTNIISDSTLFLFSSI